MTTTKTTALLRRTGLTILGEMPWGTIPTEWSGVGLSETPLPKPPARTVRLSGPTG
jgi:hypothetical protein